MRSGRMARRLIATAGMGAIIAMGVLSACAQEEKAPEPTTPKTITLLRRRRRPRPLRRRQRRRRSRSTRPAATCSRLRSRRPDRRRRLPATYPATSRTVRACSHVPWRQLTPDWSIRSRSRPPSPHCCAGGRVGRHMADGHVQRRLHEPRVASRLGEQVAAFDRRK